MKLSPSVCSELSLEVRLFPGAHALAGRVEESLVVALAHFQAGVRRELFPDRRPHVEHREVRRRARPARPCRCRTGSGPGYRLSIAATRAMASGVATAYFATSSHEMSKFTWLSAGSLQHGFDDARACVGLRSAASADDLHRMDDASEPDVRPDDRRLRMPLEQRLHLRQIDRLGIRLRERHVDVVVKDARRARPRRRNPGCDRAPDWSGWRFRPAIFDETNSLWI